MIVRIDNNNKYFIITIDKRGRNVMVPMGDIEIVGKEFADNARSIDTHLLDVSHATYNSLQSYARSYSAVRSFMKLQKIAEAPINGIDIGK